MLAYVSPFCVTLSPCRHSLGLSKIINIDEPFNLEELQALVERSLECFCNFYITSVAPSVSPHKADAFLAQLYRSDEEMEEISPYVIVAPFLTD